MYYSLFSPIQFPVIARGSGGDDGKGGSSGATSSAPGGYEGPNVDNSAGYGIGEDGSVTTSRGGSVSNAGRSVVSRDGSSVTSVGPDGFSQSTYGGGYTGGIDMIDGGGPGKTGNEFGGFFGGISGAIGATPKGSGIDPTGIAGIVDGYMDARGTTGGRIGGIIGSTIAGIPGAIIGTMIGSGKMNLGLNANGQPGEIDAEVEAIANDPNMGDAEKQQKIQETVIKAAQETQQEMVDQGMAAPATIQQMADQVYNRSYSMPTAEDYIRAIYRSELGREVDAGGLQGYLKQYESGVSLADIAKDVSTSDEGMAFDSSGAVQFNKEEVDLGQKAGRRPGDILNNPTAFLTGNMASLQDITPQMDPNAAGTTMDPTAYQIDFDRLQTQTATGQYAGDVVTQTPQSPATYDAAMSADRVAQMGQATAQQGQVSDQSQITAEQADLQGTATGINEDGTTNFVGEALNNAQTLNISRVIDTSTVSGQLLAQELGEGNYTDAKATMQGQLEILSKQFTDSQTGEPKIPSWAAGAAREVSRIAAFKGMTGTAATAAMSQALMEASLPIAQQDAQFFQTATMENLDNRQQMAVTKAQVLSNMELANLDARMTAAVENSKAFLQMDLSNLDNRQQAEIVNTQARVQSILEDANAENAARLFSAESQNDFTQFYSQLNTQIRQFNAEQKNAMERFNAGEINSTRQFNAQLENQREQFYRDMQYNVDLANARWRQTVETANTEMQFQAAQTDVKNIVNLSTESLNRIWDRADSILDYTWRSSETQLEREAKLAMAEMNNAATTEAAEEQGKGALWGGIIGAVTKVAVNDPFDWF